MIAQQRTTFGADSGKRADSLPQLSALVLHAIALRSSTQRTSSSGRSASCIAPCYPRPVAGGNARRSVLQGGVATIDFGAEHGEPVVRDRPPLVPLPYGRSERPDAV